MGIAGNEDGVIIEEETPMSIILEWLFGILIILLYYTFFEYAFGGKTLGKLITQTRAVTDEYETMDFTTVLKRSLCRLIPFEVLSFLGGNESGWHDTLSNTIVIDEANEKIFD